MQLLGADMDTKRQLEEVFCVLKNEGLAETLKILHNLLNNNEDMFSSSLKLLHIDHRCPLRLVDVFHERLIIFIYKITTA